MNSDTTDDSHLGRDTTVAGTGLAAGGITSSTINRWQDGENRTDTVDESRLDHNPDVAGTGFATGGPTSSSLDNSNNARYQSDSANESHLGRNTALAGTGLAAGGMTVSSLDNSNTDRHQMDNFDESRLGQNTNVPGTGLSAGGVTASSLDNSNNDRYQMGSANESRLGQSTNTTGTGLATGGIATSSLDRSNDVEDRSAPGASNTKRVTGPWSKPNMESDANRDAGVSNINTKPAYTGTTSIMDRPNPLKGDPSRSAFASDSLGTSNIGTSGSSAGLGGVNTSDTSAQTNVAPPDVSGATYTASSFQLRGGSASSAGSFSNSPPYPGYIHYTHGPHPTDIGNRMDPDIPHVPGEFPMDEDDYQPPSGAATGTQMATGGGLAASGTTGSEALRADESRSTGAMPSESQGLRQPTTTTTTTTTTTGTGVPRDVQGTSEHHYGRDAGLAGGAGAAGVGTYGLMKDRGNDPSTSRFHENLSAPSTAQTQPVSQKFGESTSQPMYESEPRAAQHQSEHHYGRDAAIVGGTGAAGAGIYEATKDRDDTGPASKTLGPHKSNVANVLDPRVQPEPEKMKQSSTAGPYQSDMANKADPRVQSESSNVQKSRPTEVHESTPVKTQDESHDHRGRDLGIAGAAGTAGAAGAVGASEYENRSSGTHHATDRKSSGFVRTEEPEYQGRNMNLPENQSPIDGSSGFARTDNSRYGSRSSETHHAADSEASGFAHTDNSHHGSRTSETHHATHHGSSGFIRTEEPEYQGRNMNLPENQSPIDGSSGFARTDNSRYGSRSSETHHATHHESSGLAHTDNSRYESRGSEAHHATGHESSGFVRTEEPEYHGENMNLPENQFPVGDSSGFGRTHGSQYEDPSIQQHHGTFAGTAVERPKHTYEDRSVRTQGGAYGDRTMGTQSGTYEDRPMAMQSGTYADRPLEHQGGTYGDRSIGTQSGTHGEKSLEQPKSTHDDKPAEKHRNRLQKPRKDDGDDTTEKHGLLSKILHPGRHSSDARKSVDEPSRTGMDTTTQAQPPASGSYAAQQLDESQDTDPMMQRAGGGSVTREDHI